MVKMNKKLYRLLGDRILIIKKQESKITIIDNTQESKFWWKYKTFDFIQYIKKNPDLIQEDGIYILYTSERTKGINLIDSIPNQIFETLRIYDIKIGLSTKRDGDSNNIISIPNYFIFINEFEKNELTSFTTWDLKLNKLLYMGTINSDFRERITDVLKNQTFSHFYLRRNNNIYIEFNEHDKYKFILDLPTDHEYNYDYSWSIWKKFYFKSVIFHIKLSENHHNYLYDFLKDGEDWVLCKDAKDLIDKYNYYNNNQKIAQNLAENGNRKMLSIVKNYKEIYKEYLKKCKNELNIFNILNQDIDLGNDG